MTNDIIVYIKIEEEIMQPIFTMQYGEFKVADYLTDNIKGSSVFIPVSAQEKGIDLLLYRNNGGRNKVITIQVKMSRTYYDYHDGFSNHLWFNRFVVQPNADWYILMGIYARHPKEDKAISSKVADNGWAHIMLAFSNTEMAGFMDSVRQKKNPKKPDSMFGFSFDEDQTQVLQTRGFKEPRDMTRFLIQNRIDEMEASFDMYEEKHEILTRHISELEMLMDEMKGTWENQPWGYSNGVMYNFEQDIASFADSHPELHYYVNILKDNDIPLNGDYLFSMDISGVDDLIIEAMLVAVIRWQHHNEGTLLPAIMSGAVVKWLKKLKASDEAQIQASKR